MKPYEVLPFLQRISVIKTSTGSVSVTTHKGIVSLTQPCFTYVLADNPSEVAQLLKSGTNIRALLKQKLISLAL